MKEFKITRLIKSEDLNHHGTLYAGRTAEWLVESAFVAAAAGHGQPENVVCVNIHGFTFKRPVQKGDIITFFSKIAKVGKTSITIYVKVKSEITGLSHVDGFLTFVCLDALTNITIPHGIIMDQAEDAEEIEIRKRAQAL